ncbi:MAG: cysteine desulfurase-like protein [Gemmatimonadales bacterium]
MTGTVRASRESRSLAAVRVATVDEIRARFPAVERVHNGRPVAYFDGPGGTQVPLEVVEAMRDYLLHHNANTEWAYPTSAETDALIADARSALADFLNADASEIAFGNNMTTLTFHLARALGAAWGAGDEIVITDLDHHANVAPWRRLERERGVTIRSVGVDLDSGQLDWESLEGSLGPRTRLLAIGAASNALGTISDVARAGHLAHEAGAMVFVDAVHYAPHALVDVRALDCDFLACSPYKFYGPHTGVLYGTKARIEALDVPRLDPAHNNAPDRLETGTLNHEGMVGAAAAVDFLASLSTGASRRQQLETTFAALHTRADEHVERLWSGLSSIKGVTMYGPPPGQPRTPTVSFTMRGYDSREIARHLATHALFVSHGDFYAATIVKLLGHAEDGLVRVGCACYTTADEVERLIAAVGELATV